ncbi:MAG: TMEM175 family protein [Candidatus Dormibacteria bacterium]
MLAEAPAVDTAPRDNERLRVDLFSDAVFAVAITLLVLNLPLTSASGSLLDALADRWAAFAAFGISFAIIGCVWVSHFRLLRNVHTPSGPFLFLNLAVLLTVVLVPFGTSTMATFVTKADSESHIAAALFASVLVLMSVVFGALNRFVVRQERLPVPRARSVRARLDQLRPMYGAVINTIGIGVAFVSPIAVLCMTAAVAFFYFVDSISNERAC